MCHIWHTRIVKKEVKTDRNAGKEFKKFPATVQAKFKGLFTILEEEGKLEEPYAKKLRGKHGLLEMRVKHEGQWRVIYAYLSGDIVIVLSAFRKKTQKTPLQEISKAYKRLQAYI